MTVENLSSATASSASDRMHHEVQRTQHIRHPPRMSLPVSSRESLEPTHADEDTMVVETREAVSARAAPMSEERSVTPDTPPAAQPSSVRPQTCTHNLPVSLFQKDIERNVFVAIVFGILVGFLAAKCTSANTYNYRSSTTATVSDSCRRVVDRLVGYITPPR